MKLKNVKICYWKEKKAIVTQIHTMHISIGHSGKDIILNLNLKFKSNSLLRSFVRLNTTLKMITYMILRTLLIA